MRVVLQRVNSSSVSVNQMVIGQIGIGLTVLVGFEDSDTAEDIEWIASKLVRLRIFDDEQGVMNRSIQDVNGDILVISQFTLHAKTKKGNRPSYISAAKPDVAIPLYKSFIAVLERELGKGVQQGEFGAHMVVSIENDGPVTIAIDSKNRE